MHAYTRAHSTQKHTTYVFVFSIHNMCLCINQRVHNSIKDACDYELFIKSGHLITYGEK